MAPPSPFSELGFEPGKHPTELTERVKQQLENMEVEPIDPENWVHLSDQNQGANKSSDMEIPKIILPDGTEID